MPEYRITCVNSAVTTASHPHIVSVGVHEYRGAAGVLVLAVVDVAESIDAGDTFYTYTGGTRSEVSKYTCRECSIKTLRSHSDGAWTNNLDDMNPCPT